jgi:hypothetical protein
MLSPLTGSLGPLGVAGNQRLLLQETFTDTDGALLANRAPDVHPPGSVWGNEFYFPFATVERTEIRSNRTNLTNLVNLAVVAQTIDCKWPDVVMTADITSPNRTNIGGFGFIFRRIGNTMLRAFLQTDTLNHLTLQYYDGSVVSVLATGNVSVPLSTTFTNVSLTALGTSLSFTVNGVTLTFTTSQNQSGTLHGICNVADLSPTSSHIDNLQVIKA